MFHVETRYVIFLFLYKKNVLLGIRCYLVILIYSIFRICKSNNSFTHKPACFDQQRISDMVR